MFYAVSIEHPSQFFREILFDLRMSKNAGYIFAQVRSCKLLDFLLDTAIETPCVDLRGCRTLLVEQTNASYVCKGVMSI